MTNGMAPIPAPTGWTSIKTAYQPLRDKLVQGRSTGLSSTVLMGTADYWIARLNQDKLYVAQGTPQAGVPEPAGWTSIKTAYESGISAKLAKAGADHASKSDQVATIDYWIARLNQDKSCIALNVSFVPYP